MKNYEKKARFNAPAELKLEVTRSCPSGCLHCSANAGPSANAAMRSDDAVQIVHEFAEMGGRVLVLTGGEPLEHPGCSELAAFSRRAGLKVVLYTTGMFRGPVVATHQLSEIAEFVDHFLFCLHGSGPWPHDKITGIPGSFDTTMAAMSWVMSWDKPLSVHHVPLMPNQGNFLALCKLITEIGLQSVKVLRFVPQGRGATNREKLALDETGVSDLAEQIRLARHDFPGLRIHLGAPYSMLDPYRPIGCHSGLSTMSIGADLDCYPCDGFKNVANGAFREKLGGRSLRELWSQSEILASVRKACRKLPNDGAGGCLAQKFLRTGSLDGCGVDPLYRLLKQPLRLAV